MQANYQQKKNQLLIGAAQHKDSMRFSTQKKNTFIKLISNKLLTLAELSFRCCITVVFIKINKCRSFLWELVS